MSAANIYIPSKVWTRADLHCINPVLAQSSELTGGDLIDRRLSKALAPSAFAISPNP